MKSFVYLMLSLVLLGVLSVQTEPVSAGSNGQQIEIYGPYSPASRVVIRGTNQYGRVVTYDSRIHGNMRNVTLGTADHYTYINNWWWVGNVQVTVYWGTRTRTCSINVPKNQWFSNWTGVRCLY